MFIQAMEWLGGWVARMLDRIPPLMGRAFLIVVGLEILAGFAFMYLICVAHEYDSGIKLFGLMMGLAAYLGITKTTQNLKLKKLDNDSK